MPYLKRKYEFAKVWRPSGTPWSEGEPTQWAYNDPIDLHAMELAVERAVMAFRKEFGRFPNRETVIVEIVGGHSGPQAVVYELPAS